jgi:hypothetical protein
MSLEMLEFRYETDGHILTEQMVDQYILPSLYCESSWRSSLRWFNSCELLPTLSAIPRHSTRTQQRATNQIDLVGDITLVPMGQSATRIGESEGVPSHNRRQGVARSCSAAHCTIGSQRPQYSRVSPRLPQSHCKWLPGRSNLATAHGSANSSIGTPECSQRNHDAHE